MGFGSMLEVKKDNIDRANLEHDLNAAKSLLENRNSEAERIQAQIQRTKEANVRSEQNGIKVESTDDLTKLDQEYSEVIQHAQQIRNQITALEKQLQ